MYFMTYICGYRLPQACGSYFVPPHPLQGLVDARGCHERGHSSIYGGKAKKYLPWLWPTSPAWPANWSGGPHSPPALNPLRTPESPSTSLQKTPLYFNYLNLPKKYIYFTGEKIIPRYDRKVPGAFSIWSWRSHLSLMRPASRMLVTERWASTLS